MAKRAAARPAFLQNLYIFGKKTHMKKLTFLLLAAFSGLTASAQTEKGSQWIGGTISARHDKTSFRYNDPAQQPSNNNTKNNMLRIGPSYNYFLANNLGLAVELGYENTHQDSFAPGRSGEIDSKSYYASLDLKKYLLYENKIGVAVGPYAIYSRGKQHSENNEATFSYNDKATSNGLTAGLGVNFVYFPVKKVALTAGIGSLRYYRYKLNGDRMNAESESFDFDIMSSTTFSIFYVFGK
jgi:hypothetical protein